MAGKKGNYASLKILFGILLFVGLFGGIISVFFNFSGRSLYERFATSNISIEYYYMDGCGHCNNFTPIWDDFNSKIPSDAKYKTAKYNINSDGEERGTNLKIRSAPTIVAIDTSKPIKEENIIARFEEERTVEKLLAFANKYAK